MALGLGPWFGNIAATSGAAVASGTTWNPADFSALFSLTGGNLVATHSSTVQHGCGRATTGHSGTGDWSFTITLSAMTDTLFNIGLANLSDATTAQLGQSANSIAFNASSGDMFRSNATVKVLGLVLGNGDVLTVRLKNNNLYMAKNGTYAGSDPVAETGGFDVTSMGTLYPGVSGHDVGTFTADFTNWP